MSTNNRSVFVFSGFFAAFVILVVAVWAATGASQQVARNGESKDIANVPVSAEPDNDSKLDLADLKRRRRQSLAVENGKRAGAAEIALDQSSSLGGDERLKLEEIEAEEIWNHEQFVANDIEQAQEYLNQLSEQSEEEEGGPIDRVSQLFEFMEPEKCQTECQSAQELTEDYVRARTEVVRQTLEEYVISEGAYDSMSKRRELASLQSTYKKQMDTLSRQMPMLSGLPEILETTVRLPNFLVELPSATRDLDVW